MGWPCTRRCLLNQILDLRGRSRHLVAVSQQLASELAHETAELFGGRQGRSNLACARQRCAGLAYTDPATGVQSAPAAPGSRMQCIKGLSVDSIGGIAACQEAGQRSWSAPLRLGSLYIDDEAAKLGGGSHNDRLYRPVIAAIGEVWDFGGGTETGVRPIATRSPTRRLLAAARAARPAERAGSALSCS